MKKEFTPYEQALALKELGFDEPCFASYSPFKPYSLAYGYYTYGNCIAAPLYQQAFRWFRKKYELHQIVLADQKGKYDIIVGERISGSCLGQYETYEEAELFCLIKLIEIVKNK